MWENNSIRETEGEISTWTNMNPWGNPRSGSGTTVRSNGGPQSPMAHSQGYSSAQMRQPSRSWDLHTHQQFHPGMTAKWGSNSNWSGNGSGTPPSASLNSPVKGPSDIWGPIQQQQQQQLQQQSQQQSQWPPSMANGTEQKRNPTVLHRSMTGPSQTWNQKVDQQTPWDMGNANEQQQQQIDWNNAQKWNSQQQQAHQQQQQAQQQYAWHQAESSPEWANGSAHQEMGWNAGSHPSEAEALTESGSPQAWQIKQQQQQHHQQQQPPQQPQQQQQPAQLNEAETGLTSNADMVWQDPNPKMKQKKLARDTGTAIWGDPESQKSVSTIRHWKSPEASSGYPNGLENDWTAADPTHRPDHGWGEPSLVQNQKMWNIANAWSDPQDDSCPDTIVQKLAHALGTTTLMETLQSAATANPQLAHQLSEQFLGAVNRNWINQSVYTVPIIPSFAKLHQLIKRMYKKENEVLQLRQLSAQAKNSCKDRILSEIQHTKNELAEFQRAICGIPPTPVTTASTPTDGQSRLKQWKQNGNAMAAAVSKQQQHAEMMHNGRNGHVASSLPSDASSMDAMMNSLISAAHHLTINAAAADSLNNSWKQGSLEWSPPATRDDRRKSSEESALSLKSQLTADVQEFIPGKKWEYRDPNKISEDPNATPGSCKPNPLLTSAALRLQMNGASKDSLSSAPNSAPQNGWNSRIPGKPMPNRSPMMSPNTEQPSVNENYIYLPHCWLLVQLDNNITDLQFQQVCHHAGQIINFCMIGPKIACVKFNNSNVDLVIHRIKSEYPFSPEQFRIVSDEEFNNKMLKHTRYLHVNGYDSQPPVMSHQTHHHHSSNTPWNYVPQMYHNDPACQY